MGEGGVVDEERGEGERPGVHGAEAEEVVRIEGGAEFPCVVGGGCCGGGDAVELLVEEGAEEFFGGPGDELVLDGFGPMRRARAEVVGGFVEGVGEGDKPALEPEVGDCGGSGRFGGGLRGFGEDGGEGFWVCGWRERFDGGGGEGGEEQEREEDGEERSHKAIEGLSQRGVLISLEDGVVGREFQIDL